MKTGENEKVIGIASVPEEDGGEAQDETSGEENEVNIEEE